MAVAPGRVCFAARNGRVHCAKLTPSLDVPGPGNELVIAEPVPWIEDAEAVGVGRAHACALREGGSAVCWGKGELGQLGRSAGVHRVAPAAVPGVSTARMLTVGDRHSCVAMQGGGLRCFGDDRFGQLGDGATTVEAAPVEVSSVTGVRLVAAGAAHTCVTDHRDRLMCFGAGAARLDPEAKNGPFAVARVGQVSGLAAFGPRTCFIERPTGSAPPASAGGKAACVDSRRAAEPSVLADRGAVEVAIGGAGACARLARGRLRCALGAPGRTTARPRGLPFEPVVAGPFVGHRLVCALAAEGALHCREGLEAAFRVPAPGAVRSVALDGVRLCAGLEDGRVACRRVAELEAGVAPLRPLEGFEDVSEVAAGRGFVCAREASGQVRCMGRGDYGQLGDGRRRSSATPTTVAGLDDAIALGLGARHACAVRAGGRVACWGSWARGQLGPGRGAPIAAARRVELPR
jgi:hypothetical protein